VPFFTPLALGEVAMGWLPESERDRSMLTLLTLSILRFDSKVEPTSAELKRKLEAVLAKR
jgi:hypothetical protein